MILVFTTFEKEKEAKEMAGELLKKRLISCANIRKISSLYEWKGKMEKETEYELELKAAKRNYRKIESEIRKTHPYELPAIYAIEPFAAEKKFDKWASGTK